MFDRLRRFLVLGSEGGTYYASESKLTKENVRCLDECIQEDAYATANMIKDMRDRAPKRDVIFYSLAYTFTKGDAKAKAFIEANFNDIVRTGSDILQFTAFIDEMRGWGRSLRRLVSSWYENHRQKASLAFQLAKYQNRFGWTHRDVLMRCRYGLNIPELRWATKQGLDERLVRRKDSGISTYYPGIVGLPPILEAYDEVKRTKDKLVVTGHITDHRMTHEMIPNEWKDDVDVWSALLSGMPMTAMIRNLGKMTSVGLLKPFTGDASFVVEKLCDEEIVRRSKVHPIQFLTAYIQYKSGEGFRGSLKWDPVPQIVDSLQHAFYASFDNVEPTGKNTFLALDVSGSMSWGEIAKVPGLTPAMASAAMAMVVARTEPKYCIMGFESGIVNLNITAGDSLESALKKVSDRTYGGTDCALPMIHAQHKSLDVESFVVLTDNETWYGSTHPSEALRSYRAKQKNLAEGYRKGSVTRNIKESCANARLAVVGMTATEFTIADPNDSGMLDVVGFDSATPQLMSSFFKGEV